jgi:hypothetical protein
MNKIELAKSGRATCRQCREKIPKNDPRLGEEYEFSMGSSIRSGLRWYHLSCAITKLPDMVAQAEINAELPEDVLKSIEEIKKKGTQSAFTVKGFSDLKEEDVKVNVKAKIIRPMSVKQEFDDDGNPHQTRTLYVQENGIKGKMVLWNKHSEVDANKNDEIFILKGHTELGSDEKIVVHANLDSKVFINPDESDLETGIPKFELYSSNSWKKPKGEFCRFEYAKSGRASCSHCDEKIQKAELKIVKPEWGENEDTGRFFPSSTSYHTYCAIEAELGDEIIHEAITRLTPELIEENKDSLSNLTKQVQKNEKLHSILIELN